MRAQPEVLYMMGHGWSGSTILGNLLGELTGFVHVGELRRLWGEALPAGAPCGCGRPIRECPVWSAVLSHPLVANLDPAEVDRWHVAETPVRRTPGLLRLRPGRPTGRPRLDGYLDAADRLYRAVAEVTGSRVIVDTSKRSGDAAALLLMPGVRPAYVHLVRDPRGVAHSWARREGAGHGPARTSRDWMAFNLLDEAVARRAGSGRALRLRYEDLTAVPARSLSAVTALLAEPSPALPLEGDGTALLGENHAVFGNPVGSLRGKVEIREDDRWRRDLRRADRMVVTALTLPLLLRYGYPLGVRVRS